MLIIVFCGKFKELSGYLEKLGNVTIGELAGIKGVTGMSTDGKPTGAIH